MTYAHTASRILPTCDMSLGSLTSAMPETRDFVKSLQLHFDFPLAVIDSPTLHIYPSQYYSWRNNKRLKTVKLKYSFRISCCNGQKCTCVSLSFQRVRIWAALFAVYHLPLLVTWRPIITARPERLPVHTPFLAPPSSCSDPLLLLYFSKEGRGDGRG
jgi:hypothetical protein